MPSFHYNARSREGQSEPGVLEARDRRDALQQLQNRGLIPISVEEKAPVRSAKASPGKGTRATPRPSGGYRLPIAVVLQFSMDLRDLLSAGMTLGSAVQKLARQSGQPQRTLVLSAVHEDIVQGKSLSEALAKHPRSFSEFYVSLVRAGEAAGQLQDALENAVRHYERAAQAREQVVGALVYPCIVAVFGVLTIVACLIWVIPNFTQIFLDLDQALPGPTRLLIFLSNALLKYGLLLVLLLALAGVAFTRWRKTPSGRFAWHKFLLRAPVFNRMIRSAAYANFARTLSNLLINGVPVLRALDIVKNTANNAVLEREIGLLKNRVTDGSSLSRPLAESGVFPEVFTDMLSVGEEAGEVPRSLAQIARRYDQELTRNIKLLTTVLEPLLMVLIAGAVAFVAISMLLPVFQLTKGLR